MYKAYLDGELLYHPNVPKMLPFAQAKWEGEVNKAGKFEFLVYKKNQQYGNIKQMKSIVTLYDDNYRLFRGRVYSVKRNFLNGLLVTCEGELAFLNDIEVRPYTYNGDVDGYFRFLVKEYNDQASADRKFLPGRCTVTDPNGYIVRENSNYTKVLKEMQDKLIGLLGGYLWTREEADGVYIDYLADFELTNTQSIKFGENLLDLTDFIKGNDIASAIRPLGAKIVDENGNETDERLNITSVNNGVDYVYSKSAVDQFGWIYKTVVYDDITVASNLLKRGMKDLETTTRLNQTIELSAVDCHYLNVDIQSFRLGRYTLVESKPHDFNSSFLTRKLTINILKPGSDSKMNLGDERKTFVDKQVATGNKIDIVSGKVDKTVKDGKDGVGIASSVVQYYLSTSSTELVGGTWLSEPPAWVNGSYYWQKIVTTYTNGEVKESTPVCITGAKGDTGKDGSNGKDGLNGSAGRGITSITTEFYLSSSKTEQIDGEWLEEMPTWSSGLYLWTRSKIIYNNPVSTEYTEPICDSSWEAANNVQNNLDENVDEIKTIINDQYTKVTQDNEEYVVETLKSYVKSSSFDTYQKEVLSQFKQTAEDVSLNFSKTTTQINNVDGDLQQKWNQLIKHIEFSGDTAIIITSGGNAIALELDNEKGIVFKRNGVRFGWWDGVDFHTGNIVVELNKRAQLGNFAFVPRSDGSLSFLQVGG